MYKKAFLSTLLIIWFAPLVLQWSFKPKAQGSMPLGRVDGIVKDSHDASVPSATILFETKLNGKKFKQRVEANRDGLFKTELPPGSYRVTVKFPGFHNFERKGMIVEPGNRLTFDIMLKENPRKVTSITD